MQFPASIQDPGEKLYALSGEGASGRAAVGTPGYEPGRRGGAGTQTVCRSRRIRENRCHAPCRPGPRHPQGRPSRSPAGHPVRARLPARVHPGRHPDARHEAVPGEPGQAARHQPHPAPRGAPDAAGGGPGRDRAEPADPGRGPGPAGTRRRLRQPDPARDAGPVHDHRPLRCGVPQGGQAAADRDAPGGQVGGLRRLVRRARRLPPAGHRGSRGRRCSASCGRSPTGPPATSASTSCPIRAAGRRRATWSTPRSWSP